MRVSKLLGWLFLLAALAALGWEAVLWRRTGVWPQIPLGQVWFALDSASLNLVQAVIERYLWPPLWDPVIFTLLLWRAWVVLGAVGLALLLLARLLPRRRRRRSLMR